MRSKILTSLMTPGLSRRAFMLFCMVLPLSVYGQDSLSKRGGISADWRTFYSATFNENELKNFHAMATGGKFKYIQPLGKRWNIGIALYASVNTGVQDLTERDASTARLSRYEAGLFDVVNLDNHLIAFPGELYVQYEGEKHGITIGRMKIKSPFLNPQDGRMIPTLEQGLWYSWRPDKWKVHIGIFNQIAPRSTSGFFGVGESIGKYPGGRHVDGNPSQYANNTNSDFILIFNIDYDFSKKARIQLWDYFVDNVFHTLYTKPVFDLTSKTKIAFEWLHQNRIGNGGNDTEVLRYFVDKTSNVLGLQLSHLFSRGKLSIGYNHILEGGRFLFPREWGRESLFSFQKRERSEGTANNHALVINYDRSFGKDKQWKSTLSIGRHWKPDVSDVSDNKYAFPNYTHINLDIFFQSKTQKRFRPELLLTYKKRNGDIPDNPNFIFNKVNMFHLSLIVNYHL